MNKARLRKLVARENRRASKNARLGPTAGVPVSKKRESKDVPKIVESINGVRKTEQNAAIQKKNASGAKRGDTAKGESK